MVPMYQGWSASAGSGDFSLLLGDDLGALLVDLGFSLDGSLGSFGSGSSDALFLRGDLRLFLGLPGSEATLGFLFGESALGDTALEMFSQHDTLVGEDAAGRGGRLGSFVEPVEGAVTVEDDGSGVGVRVVEADLFDQTAVTRCACVGDDNVKIRVVFLAVARKADLNSHFAIA